MWVNRLQELRKALVHKGLDGMYISSYENYRYFSGFTGSNCHLLITAGQSILITDGRYTQQAQEQTEGFDPEPMPLSILYEDPYFLAVDKPAGMLVHPSPQKNSGTLANGVLYHLQQSAAGAGVHPVTRLDRDTFGVVLLAKNANVHDRFCRLLREKQLEKTYLASVFGHPPQDAGEIDLPVYKVGGGSLIRVVDARGQQALTRYRVLETAGQTALLELHPMTGRTHQLRLHCMASGFPILGDPQYTGPEAKAYSDAHGLQFQQLCAARLVFPHPMTGERIEICSKQTVFFPKD